MLKRKHSLFIEKLNKYRKQIKFPLDFQVIFFRFIGSKLKLVVIETNLKVQIVFEEDK